ncbi:BTAD domain-containing putative transcriptional regulator [Streptomyces sp. NPDC093094]|uniref:AfsR/SARP family transcriptional regulator n=1 Tax=Streptomyces sp. NPDC093094 TaxID=3366026 RepID=UPI0037F7B18B
MGAPPCSNGAENPKERHEPLSALRFGLLGPPVLYDGGGGGRGVGVGGGNGAALGEPDRAVRTVRSGKARSLLAALLLEAGRVVSVGSLKDALWGGEPPMSAHASLHNHVARLRRLLDDPERLRAVPPGYLLRVEQGELDVHVFEAHVVAARSAHTRGDWERTVRECTAALALWRGTPLSGLPDELGGYAFVQRLAEARLLLLEWRYDAELAVPGTRPDGLVPELTALAAEHPLREAYHRQLMLALHATGRQAEALAVHRDLRARLVEELGVEPGPLVREAHLAVLRGDGGSLPAGLGRKDPRTAPAAGTARPPGGGRPELPELPEGTEGTEAPESLELPEDLRPADRADLARAAAPPRRAATASGPARKPEAAPACGAVRTPAAAATAPGLAPTGHATAGPNAAGPNAAVRPNALVDRHRHQHQQDQNPAHDPDPVPDRPADAPPAARTPLPGEAAGPASRATPSPAAPSATGFAPSAAPGGVPDRPATPRPAQLPPPPAHFTGRACVRDALLRSLARPSAVTVVSGMAGVGKSALALHVAHGLRERFPDGQLYVNLHGATPGMTPLTPAQALAALLRDLGTEPRRIPEHPDAAAALLRSLLAPTRTLMVLDDAANAAQVRPLLPAGSGCAVIVTSRSPLAALDGADRFPLTPLSEENSAALLRAVSGRDGLDAGHPLVRLTGRLPLALRVVAARLAARSALTPEVLAGQLAATQGRLHHLEYDDLSVRRSLAVAHEALAASDREADRDAAAALGRIGALDLPAYGAPLLARLLGTDERRAEAALDRLVDVALLEETAYGRYAPHDLVRDFARELAHSAQDGGVARIALRWYAAVAERILTAIAEPGPDLDDRRRPTTAQPPAHTDDVTVVPPFASPEDAFAWADGELENIVALVERHAGEEAGGTDTEPEPHLAHLSALLRLLFPCVQRSGRVAEMEVLGRAALGAARRLGDAAAEAYALGDLAALHFLTGRQKEALALNDQALEVWQRLGAVTRIRRCLNNRGLLLEGLGLHAESEAALRRSLEYSRQLNDPQGEAVTYSHLGNLYEHTDPRAAIEQHRRSLAIGVEIGAVIVQHSAHCNIGYAHLTLGEPGAALPHFEESLRILGGHGDWHGESQTRLGLVRALRLLGDTGRAGRECAELLDRADARADGYTGALARHQHGLLLRERGRTEEAHGQWRAALTALDGTDAKSVVEELRGLLARQG